MVEIRDLEKSFGRVQAVSGLSFAAADGAITGLLGENGAGKTTTLGLICGAIKADAGSIHIDEDDVNGGALEQRRRIGSLLDHRGLYGRLTARENITYFGELHGIPAAILTERVEQVLSLMGLESIADRPTVGFSQGECMKVALGRAVIHSPKNLLLDEPTNGLDVSSVRALRTLLRQMRDRGLCVIFSSHILEEVRVLCDRIVVIAKGRLVAQGAPEEICRQTECSSLEDAFVKLTHGTEA